MTPFVSCVDSVLGGAVKEATVLELFVLIQADRRPRDDVTDAHGARVMLDEPRVDAVSMVHVAA